MEFLAALVALVGSICYLSTPKSKVSVGIWISSVFTGTLAVLSATYPGKPILKAILISVIVLLTCMEIGFWGMYKQLKRNMPR